MYRSMLYIKTIFNQKKKGLFQSFIFFWFVFVIYIPNWIHYKCLFLFNLNIIFNILHNISFVCGQLFYTISTYIYLYYCINTAHFNTMGSFCFMIYWDVIVFVVKYIRQLKLNEYFHLGDYELNDEVNIICNFGKSHKII